LDPDIIIILISLTLFLAYLGSILYSKTHIPDIFWLIIFGAIIGPILKLVKTEAMIGLAPMLVSLALNLLMFEAGMNVDLKSFRESMRKSIYLGLFTFILTTILVGYGVVYLLPVGLTQMEGLLLGAIIGGTSTSTTLSTLNVFNIESGEAGKCRRLLVLESIITDSLSIVTTMTIIRVIQSQYIPLNEGIKNIVFVFTISLLIGFAVGILWVQILNVFRNRPFNYIMTLSAVFSSYIFAELIGGPGSGPLAALVFGITLNNYPLFARRININDKVRIEKRRLREFHEEVSFLIKSFLFFFVGLQMSLKVEYILIGVCVTVAIGLVRTISVYMTNLVAQLSTAEAKVSRMVFSNGLTAIVLSQLPLFTNTSSHFANPNIFTYIVVPTILTTVLFGSLVGPVLYSREEGASEEKVEVTQTAEE